MESQLFDWKDWDQVDTMVFTFTLPKLKVQIGEYPPGTEFKYATIDYERGKLEFYQEGLDPVAKFNLTLLVAP